MENKYVCSICHREFSKFSIKNHLRWHEENPDRMYPLYVPPDDLHCPYCGSLRPNFRSWSQHKRNYSENPDVVVRRLKRQEQKKSKELIPSILYSRFDPNVFVCQYCGKHTTTQGSNFKNFQSCMSHETRCRYNPKNMLLHPECVSDLEKELDDDGKLFIKWCQKRANAKTMGNGCFLTFDDYCYLVKEAGLVSSKLGINGEGYDLARYEDKGPYAIGNCRFITHAENNWEKPAYVIARARRSEQELIEKIKQKKKIERKRKVEPKIYKDKDPRYSGVHNSGYGSHWITNGSESKKWRPWKDGEIPEGWRLGRVIKT